MATALFISEQYIKDMSYLDENVDVNLIRPVIKEAQDLHIHPLLGSGLYNQLISQVVAGNVSTGTISNKTLLDDYIAPALKYWTLYEGIDVLTFKMTNKSIMMKNSENSNPISVSDVKRLMDRLMDKAQWYDKRIINYLKENVITFPLYLNPGNGIDIIRPDRTAYQSGIFLGSTYTFRSVQDRYENPNAED